MKKPIVYMFSGQGSQYFLMGKELYENHPRFKLWMDHCDSIVSPMTGSSILEAIYQPANRVSPFDHIIHTNPALISIQYSLSRVLMEMNIRPDFFLGYSLGEFVSAILSGAITLDEGLELTVDFAQLLYKESPPAAMLAILESENYINLYPDLFERSWLTGRNFKSNFVVSGLVDDMECLRKAMKHKGVMCQKLPVNYGFHTPIMDELENEFKTLAQSICFSQVRTPMVSSVTLSEVKELDENHLWKVIREPVNFEDTVQNIIKEQGDCIFIDVGPSGTLSTFIKYIKPNASNSIHLEVINQYGKNLNSLDKLRKALDTLSTPEPEAPL